VKASLVLLMSGALFVALGCSGGSSGGSGGSLGAGGAATGTGGSGGGSAGHEGSAGAAASGGAGGYGGVLTGGGAGGHGGASAGGGVGGHAGATSSGGAGGHAGAGASGGAGGAGGRAGTNGGGGAGGAIACGKNVCPANQYCCSESCGLCAPIGATCVALACTDAGVTSDAGACVANPAGDSLCTDSAKPNFYRCILSTLPPPCALQNGGNVTNNYCCP